MGALTSCNAFSLLYQTAGNGGASSSLTLQEAIWRVSIVETCYKSVQIYPVAVTDVGRAAFRFLVYVSQGWNAATANQLSAQRLDFPFGLDSLSNGRPPHT